MAGKWTTAILVSIGVFIALLDTTIVDIVLPKMMSALETDIYGVQWVVITYFLGAAIAMTAVGWVAEAVGHRDTYIFGISLFVAMSALAGMAESLEMMITVRFIQGLAEGTMMPVSLLILYEAFPPEERGLAMGVYGISASFAPALGPTLGGLLTEYLNWRWVFYINVPIGIVDVVLIWHLMGNVKREKLPPFDFVGFILVSVSLSALIVFLGKGQEYGWLHSDYIVNLIIVFVVTGVAAALWVTFGKNPLYPRRIIAHQPFRLGVWSMMLFSVTAYGFFFLLPIYLQRVHGYTTLDAGLILLPGALFAGVATLLSGFASDRVNPKAVAAVSLIGAAAASWYFHTDMDTPRGILYGDYIFWGFFVGATFAPVTLLSLGTLAEEDVSNGSTLVNIARLIAGSIGTSYATSLLSVKRDTFTEALGSNLTWAKGAVADLLGRLSGAGVTGETLFDPDRYTRAAAVLQGYLSLRGASYAFEAAYQYLALFPLAALLFVLLVKTKGDRKAGPAVVH